jgi:hypothetical protein
VQNKLNLKLNLYVYEQETTHGIIVPIGLASGTDGSGSAGDHQGKSGPIALGLATGGATIGLLQDQLPL